MVRRGLGQRTYWSWAASLKWSSKQWHGHSSSNAIASTHRVATLCFHQYLLISSSTLWSIYLLQSSPASKSLWQHELVTLLLDLVRISPDLHASERALDFHPSRSVNLNHRHLQGSLHLRAQYNPSQLCDVCFPSHSLSEVQRRWKGPQVRSIVPWSMYDSHVRLPCLRDTLESGF